MNDRELLEAAAKAAGMQVLAKGAEWPRKDVGWFFNQVGDHPPALYDRSNHLKGWAPLTDDGDALRLAVKLNLQVTPGTYRDHEATAFHAGKGEAHEHVHYQQDLYAATRRAIVRAAAEIGARQ